MSFLTALNGTAAVKSSFNNLCEWKIMPKRNPNVYCSTLKVYTWFRKPTTRISAYFSVVCSMRFLFASNKIFWSIWDLAGSIHLEIKLPAIIVLWTQRIKTKMHLLHFILFTKHRSIALTTILRLSILLNSQCDNIQIFNWQRCVIIIFIIVYDCHVHICCECVSKFVVGILVSPIRLCLYRPRLR